MTLTQFVDFVRRRHRASSDSNWSDEEIYGIATARCNEILSVIGLLQDTDTDTTVASTQSYAWPTDAVSIRAIAYDGELIKQISWEQAETYKTGGTFPERKPEAWVNWGQYIYMVPIPDDAETITFYYYKEHPFIDGTTQTTIDIPSVLHFRLADAVIGDMFVKELNTSMAQYYEGLWNQKHLPAIRLYAMNQAWGHSAQITDVETVEQSDFGVV